MKQASPRGFTLVELLVVIGVIGIIATFVVVQLGGSRAKTRDTRRKNDLAMIQKALEIYYTDNEAYPSTSGGWWGACSGYGSHPTSGTNGYVPSLAPKYIGVLPVDPQQATLPSYACYLYRSDGQQYKLLAHMSTESQVPASDPFYDIPRSAGQFTYGLCGPTGAASCAGW